MTPKEQEIAIGELEERVDRLRNIYEQYFLGFEKLEPTVPRKDVDRRFAILRKEQIRNTALRFRFQVVTQKFNTYAMHWVRICRQIEDGTYKRHVRKAKARFGDGARAGHEGDVSIDVDMDDFTEMDVDGALAEANASVASYEPDAGDTVPPPPAPERPPGRDRAPPPRQMVLTTPGTSFAVAGRRESLHDLEPNTPLPTSARAFAERTARGATLPEGAKPRILRKRGDSEPAPAAARSMPAASSPRLPAPSSPDFDAPPPVARPSGPRIQRAAPPSAPESSPRLPLPSGPSGARMPIAPIVGPPSAGRLPIAPPAQPPQSASAGGQRAAPSDPRGPAPSAGRFPASPAMRAPPGVPGGGGAPGGGSAPSAGGMRVPPPASVPRLPPTTLPRPPMGPGSAGARPAPPPSAPGNHDTVPPAAEQPPNARPRAPLPLPSQITRPAKKE